MASTTLERTRRLIVAQGSMEVGHKVTNESGNGNIRSGTDRHIHEGIQGVPAIAPHGEDVADETVHTMRDSALDSLTIAFRRKTAERTASLIGTLPQMTALSARTSARIAIKAKGKILFIDAADVIAVEARGNYVLLLHTSSSHMLRESISIMEEKLNLHGFVRIHRSVLVNAALVEEIQPWSTGEYVLRMRGGREYTVTRTFKKNLQLLAQAWIGTEGFDTE